MQRRLTIQNLSIKVGKHRRLVFASTALEFTEERCLVVLSGDNGSGKTTFLNAVSGQLPVSDGSIALDGLQLSNRSPSWSTRHGIVRGFQKPVLCDELTVWENIALPTMQTWWSTPQRMRNSIANRLEMLPQGFAEASPAELSFGQRRVVEMARIEIQSRQARPRMLLLDEPFAGLDQDHRSTVAGFISTIVTAGVPTIVVEHDPHLEGLATFARMVLLSNSNSECVFRQIHDQEPRDASV